MARRYRDFARLPCNHGCLRKWGDPLGFGLRKLARKRSADPTQPSARVCTSEPDRLCARDRELGSTTPALVEQDRPRRQIGGPVSAARAQVTSPESRGPLHTVAGSWPHSADMRPYFMLIPALKEFDLVGTRTSSSLQAAQSGPVHRLLPWHRAVSDSTGSCCPGTGRRQGWDTTVFSASGGSSSSGASRATHAPGRRSISTTPSSTVGRSTARTGSTTRLSSMQRSSTHSSRGTVLGDREAIRAVREMLDYQLARGTSPRGWAWPRVPFATSCAGERRYGRCLAGLPPHFYGGIETDKVGMLGLVISASTSLPGGAGTSVPLSMRQCTCAPCPDGRRDTHAMALPCQRADREQCWTAHSSAGSWSGQFGFSTN